jgi:hypothetical protein
MDGVFKLTIVAAQLMEYDVRRHFGASRSRQKYKMEARPDLG